ncbi:MAG: glycosyltransferase family 4 protein [Chitinophagaceae bacterium]
MPRIILGISSSFCASFLKGQVDFLVKNGWEVVIISGPGEEITALAQNERARLYRVNFSKSISPLADFVSLLHIINIIRNERPSIVNAGNPKSGFLIMLACWLLNHKKRIFTLHGLVSDSRTGIERMIIRFSEKLTCRIAKTIIVVSPSLLKHALQQKQFLPAKGIVIENGSCNGVNTDVFQRDCLVLERAGRLKESLALKGDEYVIGYVGRLSKDKGIDILFRAFNLLKENYKNIRLLIAGPLEKENPFDKKYLAQLYEDEKIYYLGKVSQVMPVYALMHILVLSSFREGFGNVLIEAASMEVPVIAPDIPGCRNALQPGHTGFLFRKGDAGQLVKAIEKYMFDDELRQLHGINGRKFAVENFSQEKIWKGLLTVYETNA